MIPPGQPPHQQTFSLLDQLESYAPPPVPGLPSPQATFVYDLDGLVVRQHRPDGSIVNLGWDDSGRLQSVQGPDSSVSYHYYGPTACAGCAPGAVAAVSDSGGVDLSFAYDGALLKSRKWSGTIAGAVSWTHDKNFRVLTETVDTGAASTATFTYDTEGLITCASRTTCTAADALRLTYSSSLPRVTGTTAAGVADTYTYNAHGALASYEARAGTSVLFREVLDTVARPRDGLGRIRLSAETRGAVPRNLEYQYDVRGRLESVLTNNVASHTFEYDSKDPRSARARPDRRGEREPER